MEENESKKEEILALVIYLSAFLIIFLIWLLGSQFYPRLSDGLDLSLLAGSIAVLGPVFILIVSILSKYVFKIDKQGPLNWYSSPALYLGIALIGVLCLMFR